VSDKLERLRNVRRYRGKLLREGAWYSGPEDAEYVLAGYFDAALKRIAELEDERFIVERDRLAAELAEANAEIAALKAKIAALKE